ncbi:SDR family oxidoreductase [Granulicella sp. dw_53]|uniref:SDR family oxidoreductase n=1 Tax=Granulicella sp. dw_53 TaxID=2719792 RepID=UPI001BD33811|nr:SDR family oxidoreductase [Granulicella sp. dw_53]
MSTPLVPTGPLAGKVAIVTGASAGIGRATALALVRCGASVLVTARRKDRLEALCAKIESLGGKAVFFAGDASQESTAQQAVALALSTFGHLDILINNAGAGNYKNLIDTSVEEYDQLMNANMKSSFLFSRYATPSLIEQKSGLILFISSIAGLQGAAGESVYCASKFAQVGFAQALDAELRKHGINVGAICPGGTKTEFALGKGRTEDLIQKSHMMNPDDVAEAIVFACLQPPNTRISQMTVRHMG